MGMSSHSQWIRKKTTGSLVSLSDHTGNETNENTSKFAKEEALTSSLGRESFVWEKRTLKRNPKQRKDIAMAETFGGWDNPSISLETRFWPPNCLFIQSPSCITLVMSGLTGMFSVSFFNGFLFHFFFFPRLYELHTAQTSSLFCIFSIIVFSLKFSFFPRFGPYLLLSCWQIFWSRKTFGNRDKLPKKYDE